MATETMERGRAERPAIELPAAAVPTAEAPAAAVRRSEAGGWLARYETGGFYDEMFAAPGRARPHYERLFAALAQFGPEEFRQRCGLADLSLMHQGITFTVYNDDRGVERPWPLDLIPRILPAAEWDLLERGLKQRVHA